MASKNQRARAAAALKEQQRRERVRQLSIVGGIVALLAAVVGVGFWVQSGRDTSGKATDVVPAGLADNGYGVIVGAADAPKTITIYEDLQCPVCNDLENEVGAELQQAVDDGKVNVEYRMVSFLDQASTTDYSSRALNALMVVLDTTDVDTFEAYRELLFQNQPAEGGAGLPDDELIRLAVQAGAQEADIAQPIADKKYEQWIINATDQMSKDGVNGTPTVFVDGEPAGVTPQEGINAIREAIG